MGHIIMSLSMPIELYNQIDEERKKAGKNIKTGLIFVRSPFYVELLKKALGQPNQLGGNNGTTNKR